jgi:hypothetical protein
MKLTAVAETLCTNGPSLRALSQIFCFQSPEIDIEFKIDCFTGNGTASLDVWRQAKTWMQGASSLS